MAQGRAEMVDGTPRSAANSLACLQLLQTLQAKGLSKLVLCPGSRSGPLAVAASFLEGRGLKIYTAIDERSAAFFALGLARAAGKPVAVVTTSGTAVANLLPALVEADLGTIPLVLLTADRPQRLKNCGANQTVSQETFLEPCCRWVGLGAPEGLAAMDPASLRDLAVRGMAAASGLGLEPAGPVHLNLPLEEPLHGDGDSLSWLRDWRPEGSFSSEDIPKPASAGATLSGWGEVNLDPDQPGVVVAGPWRGLASSWASHLKAVERWQKRTGWPLLADALSGLRGIAPSPQVAGYDLALSEGFKGLEGGQVLRLGPLPASRRLQSWLERQAGPQVLVSEGDPRPLDPLRCIQGQWSGGLAQWPALAQAGPGSASPAALALRDRWLHLEALVQELLNSTLPEAWSEAPCEEPLLARRLSQLLPAGLAVMLANSSPVRDWESFSDPAAAGRPIFSFRGASGIDGTLSIACGLAEALGHLVLVSGDLALLHDSNGWLWCPQLRGQLLVVLVDNGGGGIFEQLPIRPPQPDLLDFDRLFAMPQGVDPRALARAHGVPSQNVQLMGELEPALTWGLAQPIALLRVVTDRRADAAKRRQLRTMAAERITLP
ncbi:MAG: 2-succinyl-5-enolpyruvyl-6-hydroxy-3-cyclohexene-1-carboxylic-acid synthase [Cyanobacteriota bacterium]|nr:2-succinyl-5-enolpyruvyl-6-hydroxy-3-cyclohexene-1-carboxylic-acid synthase [Cyanobacteriota bacterium]